MASVVVLATQPKCLHKYNSVYTSTYMYSYELACTLHTYANTYIHSRRREISHSHLTPSHNEHKKNGCSSAREQVTFSLTAAHKRTSTGQQLHKPTLTWKRHLPSLQGTDSKQHRTPSQHLQVQTVSKDANWRSTPQLRTTLRAVAPHHCHGCHRHCWHWQVLPHPVHQAASG